MPNIIAEIAKTTILPEEEKQELIQTLRRVRAYERRRHSTQAYRDHWRWQHTIYETLNLAFIWNATEGNLHIPFGYFNRYHQLFMREGL